jgi:hypothetical protein
VIECRRIKWVGDVVHVGRRDMHTGFWWGNLKGWHHFENQDMGERIILKRIFGK